MKTIVRIAGAVLTAGCVLTGFGADGAAPVKKVLMVGNSFSESVLVELPNVVKSTGDRLVLVNLMIGGCPLERHWNNYLTSETNAAFRPYAIEINYEGEKKVAKTPLAKFAPYGHGSLQDWLKADKWDIVTVQQASPSSWKSETYQPYADNLIGVIRKLAPGAEIRVHQTWAYNRQGTLDQMRMYNGLKKAYGELAAKHGFKVIPTGDAVQLYRDVLPVTFQRLGKEEIAAVKTDVIPDMKGDPVGFFYWNTGRPWEKRDPKGDYRLRWDGCHLNPEGKYLQALVWYASLFGGDPRKVTYAPAKLDAHRAEVMRACAARAVAGDFWEVSGADDWREVGNVSAAAAKPYQGGFRAEGDEIVVENAGVGKRAGAGWMAILDQKRAMPIRFSAEAKVEELKSGQDVLLYVDITYTDGTGLNGRVAHYKPDATLGWQKRTVEIIPTKPIRLAAVYTMLRDATGRARFRGMKLEESVAQAGFCTFDHVVVKTRPQPAQAGFYLRDAAAGTGFEAVEDGVAKGMKVAATETRRDGARLFDVTVAPLEPAKGDRATTLVYAIPFDAATGVWHDDPRTDVKLAGGEERSYTFPVPCGAGALTMWPLGAVSDARQAVAIGIDPEWPCVYRIAANPSLGVLFLAMDLGFAPEHPSARVKFAVFPFAHEHGMRGALVAYDRIYPRAFESRIPDFGIWQVKTSISQIRNHEDFGFKYMEGGDTWKWDDAHGIYTFKYTEPGSWWMTCLGKDGGLPTMADCVRTAEGWLNQTTNKAMLARAKSWKSSVALDENGLPRGEIQFAPWTKGIMWCMNSAPGINGGDNDYWMKNSEKDFDARYREPFPKGTDGEYVDSAEMCFNFGCDYDRRHFAGMATPLTFGKDTKRVCVAGAMASYEYVRKTAERLRARGKYVQANSTPYRTSMLVPWLDVPGTEVKWYRAGKWFPSNDRTMLYKRAVCGRKPYCFLQNTEFDEFHPYVERYMQRALAYGMLTGFFSSNGSTDCYFDKKERYEIDRPLFRKYVPLQKELAKAGWRPLATLAKSSNPEVYVEQFGDRYVTVFNGSLKEAKTAVITSPKASAAERVTGETWTFADGRREITLPPETVRMLDFGAAR